MEVSTRVQRSLPADATAPRLARDALADVSRRIPGHTADDLRLLLTELVTNAVKHAELRDGETIDLNVRALPECVEALLSYPHHGEFAPALPFEPDAESGFGLFLVDQVCDRWSMVETQGRMQAWFEVDLPHRHAA
jgi:anti-sigma regulatory factor (Ser/Thr protein kinase)